MTIELKNIKFTEWASQETNCYQGVVYVDGKPFANVSNDGHGGPDNQHPDQRWSKNNPKTKFWDEMKMSTPTLHRPSLLNPASGQMAAHGQSSMTLNHGVAIRLPNGL